MLVNVLVQSDLSAPANGYLQVTIDSSLPVGDLITKFCEAKSIEERSQYCLLNNQNHVLDAKKPISHYGLQSGDKVIFCSVNEQPQQFQSWGLVAVIAVVFSVIGFIVCLGVHLGLVTVPDSYALVLDAGSTHTSVILYRWPGNKVNNTGIVVQEDSCGIKQGGIAELHSASDVPAYLGPCVNRLRGSIPPESLDHAEIFFGATAGMRVLEELNEKLADEILIQTRKTLHDTGLKFTESKAEILTGSTEGACGWLTVNYLNNNLQTRAEPWGALDLGGASTQISFELKETDILPQNESLVANFQVYGREVKVFSKSFLCYGLVQATIRYRAYLILEAASKNLPNGQNITSPCEPAGYSLDSDIKSIFSSPCSPRIPVENQTMSVNDNVTFVGSSNWEECQSTMLYILSEEFCEKYNLQECVSIKEIPIGFQQQHFMGFSAFGYTDQSIGLGKNGTHENYLAKIKNICTRDLVQLFTEYCQTKDRSKPPPRSVQQLCFRSTYMFTLLSDIYEFNTEERWANLQFGTKIKEKDLGWALGFMVNETQSIAAPPSRYGMNTLVFVLLVILFSIFFFISAGFVFHALKSRKPLNRTYSSLGLSA